MKNNEEIESYAAPEKTKEYYESELQDIERKLESLQSVDPGALEQISDRDALIEKKKWIEDRISLLSDN